MTLEKLERLQEEANAKVKEMYEEKQIDIAETHQHVRNKISRIVFFSPFLFIK